MNDLASLPPLDVRPAADGREQRLVAGGAPQADVAPYQARRALRHVGEGRVPVRARGNGDDGVVAHEHDVADGLGVERIPADDVTLKPYLIEHAIVRS